MESQPRQLRVLFIPLLAPGHMIPMVDMAKLFSLRGVKCTILTTHGNSSFIPTTHNIQLHLVPFPSTKLPKGCENLTSLHTKKEQMDFAMSTTALRLPFEEALREICPDAVVSDMFYSWTVDVAAELGIPRIMFHGSNFFSQCLHESVVRNKIYETLHCDGSSDAVLLPGLPHQIEMLKTQIPDINSWTPELKEMIKQLKEAEAKSYGLAVNSFYELEPDYVELYKDLIKIKMWHVGPVSLCNKDISDRAARGKISSINHLDCLEWLDNQEPSSVLYICFGSLCNFTKAQFKEIAMGLEEWGKSFIWVVRNGGDMSEWMPEGFEQIIGQGRKGLIIQDWAPQVLILNHVAVGGFMTHCGWNSSLESIAAGVPTITWPWFAEQFYNEKLIVEVLKMGVMVGKPKFFMNEEDMELIKAEDIKKAIERVMGDDEEAQTLRKRAEELGKMAMEAMECGGSSYESMSLLIEDLRERLSHTCA